jgi:hypothetical protein
MYQLNLPIYDLLGNSLNQPTSRELGFKDLIDAGILTRLWSKQPPINWKTKQKIDTRLCDENLENTRIKISSRINGVVGEPKLRRLNTFLMGKLAPLHGIPQNEIDRITNFFLLQPIRRFM